MLIRAALSKIHCSRQTTNSQQKSATNASWSWKFYEFQIGTEEPFLKKILNKNNPNYIIQCTAVSHPDIRRCNDPINIIFICCPAPLSVREITFLGKLSLGKKHSDTITTLCWQRRDKWLPQRQKQNTKTETKCFILIEYVGAFTIRSSGISWPSWIGLLLQVALPHLVSDNLTRLSLLETHFEALTVWGSMDENWIITFAPFSFLSTRSNSLDVIVFPGK